MTSDPQVSLITVRHRAPGLGVQGRTGMQSSTWPHP